MRNVYTKTKTHLDARGNWRDTVSFLYHPGVWKHNPVTMA